MILRNNPRDNALAIRSIPARLHLHSLRDKTNKYASFRLSSVNLWNLLLSYDLWPVTIFPCQSLNLLTLHPFLSRSLRHSSPKLSILLEITDLRLDSLFISRVSVLMKNNIDPSVLFIGLIGNEALAIQR